MENYKKLIDIKKELADTRKHIIDAIVDMMKRHNCTSFTTTECDDSPIIVESFNDSCETMTLDKLSLIGGNDIELCCSSSYDNDFFSIKIISTDLLIDLYEWMYDYEDYIFNENEEE